MSTKFLRKAAVAERYGVNPRTVDRMWRDGRLPAPVYRGKFPLFDEADLDAADRAAVRATVTANQNNRSA
jgi:predicted site-specific integrase-resolvase